jgi:hypothetical protein
LPNYAEHQVSASLDSSPLPSSPLDAFDTSRNSPTSPKSKQLLLKVSIP